MMPVRGLIFDMDGVLWDSSPAHERAFRQVLAGAGIHNLDYSTIAGKRTGDVMRDLLRAHGQVTPDEEVTALAEAKSALALRILRESNPVAADAIDVLERLSVRYPLALASSGSPPTVNLFLDRNQARPFLRAVVTGADVEKAKPSPEIFLTAAARLGLPPEDCLVVEDAVAGVQGARAAGCRVVGFAPGGVAMPQLRAAGAETCIEALAELLPLLGCNATGVSRREPGASSGPFTRSAWTTIIAAAGRGTRLGFDLPKVLYPVAGRPILDWLADVFAPRSARLVVVVSPAGHEAIARHLAAHSPGVEFRLVEQPEPLGMGHAVECGLQAAETQNVMVVWGDQAALAPETIAWCQHVHEAHGPLATVPTLLRKNPYIHFARDADGRLTGVLQAREGDRMPEEGESDTGLFLLRTEAARRYLSRSGGEMARGSATGEINFLPLLPRMAGLPGNVITAPVAAEEESIGVNTKDEAALLERILLKRAGVRVS